MDNEIRIAAPSTTIWGRVQHRQKLADGVYIVETARHGGVVVSVLVDDKYMSDKAKAVIGNPEHGWWHFEEDCEWAHRESATRYQAYFEDEDEWEVSEVIPFDPSKQSHREAYEAQRNRLGLPELSA